MSLVRLGRLSLAILVLSGAACSQALDEPPDGLVVLARAEPAAASLYLRAVCAGVVISDGVVVTAAHCLPRGVADGRFVVYQGVRDLCEEPAVEALPVTGEIQVDVAADLIQVAVPGAGPGMEVGEAIPSTERVIAWGWGSERGVKRSCEVRAVDLHVLPAADCDAALAKEGLSSRFFCTLPARENGLNTCSGDSGGPVLSVEPDGVRVVGVTSSGSGCSPTSVGFNAKLA